MPNPSLVRRHKGLLRHSLHQLLLIDVVRYAVAGLRYLWFVVLLRRLRTLEGASHVARHTVSHNLKGLRDLAAARSLYLIRPLSTVERLTPDADLLVVGPRTEGELLALMGHGFDRRHLKAIDLISYSPWIDSGDVHALPYPENSFDAIVLGWVLAYTEAPELVASELLRVARDGAVLAIGVEWNPLTDDELVAQVGYAPGAQKRFSNTQTILDLFGDAAQTVLVQEDVPDERRDALGALVVIFSVRT